MKIRQGYVSNSSSSSFVIQGIKISNEEFDKIEKNLLNDISYKPDRYYFSDDEPTGVIIGVKGGNMEDGCVTKIKSLTDEERQKIENSRGGFQVQQTQDAQGSVLAKRAERDVLYLISIPT